MSKRGRVVGWLLGPVLLAGALAPAALQTTAPDKAMAQEQLKLARQALQGLDAMHKNGAVARYDPKFALWERRQVEAIRAAGATQAEYVAALEAYVKRLKGFASDLQAAHERGAASLVDVWDAEYRVLEAEMWLNREKSR